MKYFAFFDLDETLIRCKSMLEVLQSYFNETESDLNKANIKFQEFLSELKSYERGAGIDRETLNKFFYSKFKNFDVELMTLVCRQWFDDVGIKLLNLKIIKELRRHQKNHASVVIVSGSFQECVAVIASHLNVAYQICNQLEKKSGKYTGEIINSPVIGGGKAKGIKLFLQSQSVGLVDSYAYGDHVSDIPMLTLVDNPVAVGSDVGLIKHAQQHQWKHIVI